MWPIKMCSLVVDGDLFFTHLLEYYKEKENAAKVKQQHLLFSNAKLI